MSNCRSKAYRDLWDMVYRVARTEKYHDKNYKGENALYLVNLILRATRHSINESAVNIDDVISMIEKTVDISLQDTTFPTLPVLRRSELEQEACIPKRVIHSTFTDLMDKQKYATSPQKVWKLFYRAQRVYKSMPHHDSWLFDFDSINDQTRHEYTPKMKKCASNILYPRVIRSASENRRYDSESNAAREKFWTAGPSWLPSFEKSDFYDFNDEIPF